MTDDLWVPMVQANDISARAKAQYLTDHPEAERAWVSMRKRAGIV